MDIRKKTRIRGLIFAAISFFLTVAGMVAVGIYAPGQAFSGLGIDSMSNSALVGITGMPAVLIGVSIWAWNHIQRIAVLVEDVREGKANERKN